MVVYMLALLIGVVAGLRTMVAFAAASWAARLGLVDLGGTWLAFLGYRWTAWIATALALGEFVTDQLPSTPRRTVPVQFGGRVIVGALAGAALVAPAGSLIAGALAGVVGAVIGTLGGAEIRSRLAAAFGRDLPAALIEDAAALLAAVLIVFAMR
ncbi:DUF4126 family protein [uncultured Enterovirga sp.]|uniref:DUF4126 family protein n=1 Tax=uncultured Enterovirga sp. TaxID=2026352 RepID=UPI0035C99289